MSTGVQQACCGIWNKGACREIKDSAIAIAAALSVIALLGSILIVLASQGVPMGPLNALVAPVTPQIMYTMLIATTFATLITVTLLALLVRSYLNKQVSVKELENRRGADGEGKNIFEVIRDRYIPEKLLPGHCWKLDFEGVRGKYPMTYAVIVKNSKGEAGVLAFNSEADRKSYIERAGYRDGIKAFRDGNEIPAAYIDAKYGEEFLNKFEAENDIELNELKAGEQVVFEDVDTMEDGVSAFVLVTKKLQGMEVRYFRSEEACMDALEEPQYAHYLLHSDLETALMNANDEKLIKYNQFNDQLARDETRKKAFWIAPFKVSNGRQNVTVHIVSYKNKAHEDPTFDYFLSSTELQDFIDRELEGYEDISEEAADTIAGYSKSKAESKGSESEGSESETESDTSTEGSRFRAAANRQKFLEDQQFYYTDTENDHSGSSSQSPSDSEDDRSATPIPKASSTVESRKKAPITSDTEESDSSSSSDSEGSTGRKTPPPSKKGGETSDKGKVAGQEKTPPPVSDAEETESSSSDSESSSSSSEESEEEKKTDRKDDVAARALAEAEEKKKQVEAEVNARAKAFVEANQLEAFLGTNQCYFFEETDTEGTIHYYSVARTLGNEWIQGHNTTLEERARENAAFTKVHEEMEKGHFPGGCKVSLVLKRPFTAEVNQFLGTFLNRLISNDYACIPATPTDMQKFPVAFPLVYRKGGSAEAWEYFTSEKARTAFIERELKGLNNLNERYKAAKYIGTVAFAKLAETPPVPLALYIPGSDLFAADRLSLTKQFFLMKSDGTTTIITVTPGEGEDPVDKFRAEAKIEAELLTEELWKPHFEQLVKADTEKRLGKEGAKGTLDPRQYTWTKYTPAGKPEYRALHIAGDDPTRKEVAIYFDFTLASEHSNFLKRQDPPFTQVEDLPKNN